MISQSATDAEFVTVDATTLFDSMVRILRRNGAVQEDAVAQSTHLLEAELRGHPSHGLLRLPILVKRLRAGLIVSGLDPDTEWVTESVLRVDGRRGFGPTVARHAIALISERAASSGIAMATVAAANHIGMLAPYVDGLARSGLVGFALTTSEALVHPWGGTEGMVGTNPIAIGVPTGDEPLVLDMSTAAVSRGRIIDHGARGIPIPLGWALDAEGVPTENADAAHSISPFGGQKGYALGIALEAVVGVLTSTSFGKDVRGTLDTEFEATKGDVFICINLAAVGAGSVLPLLAAYLDDVRGSGDVRVPGDRARTERADRLHNGIRIDSSLWRRVAALETEPIDD